MTAELLPDRQSRFVALLSGAAVCVAAATAEGQGADTTKARNQRAASAADAMEFAVPETPAFVFLGVTPSKISRPTTPRSLGTELVNGIDESGKVKQGLALDATPLVYLRNATLTDYQTSNSVRFWTNLQTSLGTAHASGDTASTDIALGIRAVLLNNGDPLRGKAATDSIGKLMATCAPANGPEGGPPENFDKEANLACLARVTNDFVNQWARDHWNDDSFTLGIATGLRLAESRIDASRGTGVRGWAVYGHGFSTWGQALVQGGYTYNRGAQADSTYHAGSLGIRLLVGRSRVNAFLESVGEARWNGGSLVDKNVGSWSGGVEFSLLSKTWISTGFGSAFADKKAPDRAVVFANIKWGISEKSRLSPVP